MAKQEYVNDVYLGNSTPVRVLFPPKLDKPESIDGRGDAKYEIQIGFGPDHPDYDDLRAATATAAANKWGPDFDIGEAIAKGDFDVKFCDGDAEYDRYMNHKDPNKRKSYDQYKGLVIMKLRSKNPIAVFDTRRRNDSGTPIQVTDADEIRSTVYGGCYVALKLTFATYDAVGKDGNPGVTAYPEQVCFVSDGERIGGANKGDGSGFASVQGTTLSEDVEGGNNKAAW